MATTPTAAPPASKKEGNYIGQYVIVRTYSAGVHTGILQWRKGMEVELYDSRRLYYWEGAFTCTELALYGVKKPNKCKFPPPLPKITITEAIEIIPCTKEAEKSLRGVPNHKY